MTSPAHPYDPATVTADRRPSDDYPRHYRAAIIATYHGPGARGATWRATLRRSPNDRPASATVPAQDGPDAAVAALLRKLDLPWRMLPAAGSPDGAGRYVYVAELSPGEGQALAAGERAVWALAAAAELEAITAGAEPADPADPLALAVAMARVATGTDRPRPVVAGWAMGAATARGAITLTDILGRPIEGLTFADHLSVAGALAAAQTAGWLLTAPMRATARRLADVIGSDPDPAAVAQALAARGGCPAVIATLKGQGVAQ
jgi:hypothetical protein